jgi:hypothetical protein
VWATMYSRLLPAAATAAVHTAQGSSWHAADRWPCCRHCTQVTGVTYEQAVARQLWDLFDAPFDRSEPIEAMVEMATRGRLRPGSETRPCSAACAHAATWLLTAQLWHEFVVGHSCRKWSCAVGCQ